MGKQEGPLLYRSIGEMGAALGVTSGTASEWQRRYGNLPAPDALMEPGRHGPDLAWLAVPEREEEFRDWFAARATYKPAKRKAIRYVGTSVVAGWLGIGAQSLSVYLQRYDDTPTEDARLMPGRHGEYDRYWLPSSQRRWAAWKAGRPGQGVPGQPKPGSGYQAKSGRQTILAGEGVIAAVLASYPLRAPVPERLGQVTRAKAMDAAGGRLIVTGTGSDRFAYARDQADADAASRAVPELKFSPT